MVRVAAGWPTVDFTMSSCKHRGFSIDQGCWVWRFQSAAWQQFGSKYLNPWGLKASIRKGRFSGRNECVVTKGRHISACKRRRCRFSSQRPPSRHGGSALQRLRGRSFGNSENKNRCSAHSTQRRITLSTPALTSHHWICHVWEDRPLGADNRPQPVNAAKSETLTLHISRRMAESNSHAW